MPDNDPPTGGKRTRLLLWSGGVLTAVVAGVITAWATDAVSLLVGPADLVGLGRPALRATVIPVAGRAPDLAVAALPSTPHDRAVFLRGRFSDQAFLDVTAGLGGAWVRRARVRVVFEATRDLRITDVRLKRIGVAQPNVTRAFVQFPSESAARNPQLTLDLNDKAPFFTRLPGSKSPFFGPNSLPVKRGDQTEVGFEIQARSRSHAFALEVFYLSTGADRQESITVTDHGRPFRVTGGPARWTAYGTVYRNTGAGLHVAVGREACEIFETGRACASGR